MKIFSKVTLYNYIYRILYLGVTFIAVPISLKFLGNERYGIWQTIMTLIGFVSLTNFGIGNGLRNKVTEYFTNKDGDNIKKVISSAYLALSIISLILVIVLTPIFLNINYNSIYSDINISHKEIAIAFVITIIGFSVNFVLGLAASILYGIHKSYLVTLSQVISSVISLILTIAILKTPSNLCAMAIIYFISNVSVNILFTYILFKIDKKFIPSLDFFDKKHLKGLYTLGIGFFILQLASLLMTTSDNFIIAKLIGVSEVADYSIVNKLFNLIPSLFSLLLIQVWSQTAKDATLKNYNQIRLTVNKLLKMLIPIIIVLIMLIIFFKPICIIWLGKPLKVNNLLLIFAATYSMLACFNGIFVHIQNGLGKIKYQIISYIIAVALQIPLAYILIKHFNLGVSGVMICKSIIFFIPAVINSLHIYFYLKNKCEVAYNITL